MYSVAGFVTYKCPGMVDSRRMHLNLYLCGIFCSFFMRPHRAGISRSSRYPWHRAFQKFSLAALNLVFLH